MPLMIRADVCALSMLVILVGFCLSAGAAEPEQSDRRIRLGDQRLSVVLDAHTGAPIELSTQGEVIARDDGDAQFFDVKQDDTWITGSGRVKPRLGTVRRPDPSTAVAVVTAGDWTVEFRYHFDAQWALLTRSARITWDGERPTKLRGFWLRTPRVATSDESYYYFPGAYPPRRYAAGDFRAGAKRSHGQSPAPLIAQLSSERSVLWISDELTPASDHAAVSVSEEADGFHAGQSFAVEARMNPGESQEVGDACLWVLDTDGEAALERIHQWMRRRGHVAPADRPAWFADAVIYSFHPGGTIGSGFNDLGGFAEATKLLDSIADLGATAIWIMPIEDSGVYHPRDYYAFQKGLGTAEEYRALVDRAHELGLRVLQDCVPHGGTNDCPRSKEHPEWLAYEEDGSTLSYWCYDFNWPSWREYMAEVARHYVKEFDVDGYRVDAVGGSHITNWNPEIPYARASFSRLQGGLNMQRSLREAVKDEKPREGGLLAETQGGIYGAVSDAVYDFTGCYNVYHDLRKLPPEEFVARIRRWLHEKRRADVPDLLRLRHIESHDSLRSGLWYGVRPQRAMMAMTAWGDGIPLVYHEAENGNASAFKRIFAIRAALPELRGGEADYLCVQTPPAVFACLRSEGDGASIILINFSGEEIEGSAGVPLTALPAALHSEPHARDMWSGSPVAGAGIADDQLRVPFTLPPFGFTVCALRSGPAPAVPPAPNLWELEDAPKGAAAPRADGLLELAGRDYRAWIDNNTGLLARLRIADRDVLGPADIYLPVDLADDAGPTTSRADGDGVVFERRFGSARLQIRYEAADEFLRVRAQWLGEDAPERAGLYLPFINASRWYAATAEGLLEDAYRVRHLRTEGAFGNIYWRPQGTNVVWDSLLQPFGLQAGARSIGAKAAGCPVTLRLGEGPPPARVQWLDRIGDRRELAALIAWSDPDAPRCGQRPAFSVDIVPASGPPSAAPAGDIRAVGGGWEFENQHYRVRIARTGVITGLWSKHPARRIIDNSDLYTDGGFGEGRKGYRARDEVEAACRIWREGGALRLRCEGRLRGGISRFVLLRPPVEYFFDYTLDASSGFRLSWGVKPHAAPHGDFAFLSLILPVPDVHRFAYARERQVLGEGDTGDGSRRALQTKELEPPLVPDRIELSSDASRLLTLTDLSCGGAAPLENTFVDGRNFFLAWCDGPPEPGGERQWRWASAVFTAGVSEPETVGVAAQPQDTRDGASLLQDPGFEQTISLQPVSLRSGEALPGTEVGAAWLAPAGGGIVAKPTHSGRATAEVIGAENQYRLWRQALPSGDFEAGSRWQVSAWVKGEGIQQGDISWKTGTLRFSMNTDRTTYASSIALTGTFDWRRVTAELTTPEGLRSLEVQAGLNGAAGRMWIDDVTVERMGTR